jgi:hypothetical protein
MAKREMSGGGRTASRPWTEGNDAAWMKPKLIPDYELEPRDDSGGPEFDSYTAEFGDGGYVTGDKAHLSVSGGRDDDMREDEISEEPRARSADRAEGEKERGFGKSPGRSKRLARE